MERTLKIVISGSRQQVSAFGQKDLSHLLQDEAIEAIWHMKRTDIWFVTFEDASPVNNLDGKNHQHGKLVSDNECVWQNRCEGESSLATHIGNQ